MAQFFVRISTRETYPMLIAVYSAVFGLFVPSGGSKWLIEAPYILQAATQLHVNLGWVVQVYNTAEALPNLVNPFWMLPLNSSGLFSALPPILYLAEAGLPSVLGEGTMSLTVFLALCILGLDFMIYALFQWIYGDKSTLSRHCAPFRPPSLNQRKSLPRPDVRPFEYLTVIEPTRMFYCDSGSGVALPSAR